MLSSRDAGDLTERVSMHAPKTNVLSLEPGMALPSLYKGRITYKHLVRWCAAQENWDKLHYNQDFVRNKSRLPDVFINGALKQQFITQFLSKSFDGLGWVWRVNTDFHGIDFAEQRLEVRGHVVRSYHLEEYILIEISFQIYNLDKAEVTTSGHSAVLLNPSGAQIVDISKSRLPENWRISLKTDEPTGSVPAHIAEMIGRELEKAESAYPVDLSRLRLMAEAVMDVHPWHYDPEAAKKSAFGHVVALPLFPLHGIEPLPGSKPLSEDPEAMGREASNDIGRMDASFFGLNSSGIMNGGNSFELHSLARVGERISASSTLVGAKYGEDHPAGPSLFIDTLNRYREAGGRPFLTERQRMIYRLTAE